MPRRPTNDEAEGLKRTMREHIEAAGEVWRIDEMIVSAGPPMAELVGRTLPVRSDSQQREVGKWLATRPYVLTVDGRRVTCASSGEADLLSGYAAHVCAAKSMAGRSPPKPGNRPRGRPPTGQCT